MLRPAEETDEWFNLLALHQVRLLRGPSGIKFLKNFSSPFSKIF